MIYRGGTRHGNLPLLPSHQVGATDRKQYVTMLCSPTAFKIVIMMLFVLAMIAYLTFTSLGPLAPTIEERQDWVDPISGPTDLPDLPAVTAQTYFDIEIDHEYVGRIIIGLFGDTVPKTAKNFELLCSGQLGKNLHYTGMRFHRIIQDFIVQGGDIKHGDGTGSISIYGDHFDDEPAGLVLKHDRKYLLQMANSGPNSNGSQFCFMLGAAPHLNGHHVVFGRVLKGFDIVDKMGLAAGLNETPSKDVRVVESGVVRPPPPRHVAGQRINADED